MLNINYSKEQLLDFICEVFTDEHGKDLNRSSLSKCKKDDLFSDYIVLYKQQKRFKRYIDDINNGYEWYNVDFEIDNIGSTTNIWADNKDTIQKKLGPDRKIIRFMKAKESHRCQFCSSTTKGIDNDILCNQCSDFFNVEKYSEIGIKKRK